MGEIFIADWIPEAVDHVRQGWQLGLGDREDWLEVIRAAQNPDSQEALLKIAAPTHEWFFSEMSQSADVIAYQEIADEHSSWLPDDHEEIARDLFESFVPDSV